MDKSRFSRAWALYLTAVLLITPLVYLELSSRRGHPTMNVSVHDVVLEDGRFSMTASQNGNSGSSFRRATWKIEDGALYVTLFSGLVRRDFRQDTLDVEIEDSALEDVRQVFLRDGSDTKLIYSE